MGEGLAINNTRKEKVGPPGAKARPPLPPPPTSNIQGLRVYSKTHIYLGSFILIHNWRPTSS